MKLNPIMRGMFRSIFQLVSGVPVVLTEEASDTPDLTSTTDLNGTLDLPSCTITATLTGDATMILSRIHN